MEMEMQKNWIRKYQIRKYEIRTKGKNEKYNRKKKNDEILTKKKEINNQLITWLDLWLKVPSD